MHIYRSERESSLEVCRSATSQLTLSRAVRLCVFRYQALDDLHYGPVEPSLARAAAHLVDTYFGDDYDGETPAQGGAPPEAFAFGAPPPPPGGFSFGAPPAQPLPPAPAGRGAHLTRPAWMT